ncbi:Scr1 family TA system antitoxin-like transcriptional regulator [Micromonospora sp. NPDC051296]|uniref:Scr1 family TA system antitoxin-like transcriptional regulator n=1 Tax=Micromonospora sp. NPDC051296 TaxID=3155046 RepID=UPI00344018D1
MPPGRAVSCLLRAQGGLLGSGGRALDTGGAFARMLARLRSPQWMREWEANERQATVLRSYEPMVVPGLLQTSAYARALFRSVGLFDEEEVERRASGPSCWLPFPAGRTSATWMISSRAR